MSIKNKVKGYGVFFSELAFLGVCLWLLKGVMT